jgi:nucleotide-binding universal stress UspA family protein
MYSRVLLTVSDDQCAIVALRALEPVSELHAGEVAVLGTVHPFRTVYAHKHPLLGRRIRNLLWQANSARVAEVNKLVRGISARLRSFGWEVRSEVREGPVVDEVVRRCREVRPHVLMIGACLLDAAAPWVSTAWREVVSKVDCPVMVVKHHEADSAVDGDHVMYHEAVQQLRQNEHHVFAATESL